MVRKDYSKNKVHFAVKNLFNVKSLQKWTSNTNLLHCKSCSKQSCWKKPYASFFFSSKKRPFLLILRSLTFVQQPFKGCFSVSNQTIAVVAIWVLLFQNWSQSFANGNWKTFRSNGNLLKLSMLLCCLVIFISSFCKCLLLLSQFLQTKLVKSKTCNENAVVKKVESWMKCKKGKKIFFELNDFSVTFKNVLKKVVFNFPDCIFLCEVFSYLEETSAVRSSSEPIFSAFEKYEI